MIHQLKFTKPGEEKVAKMTGIAISYVDHIYIRTIEVNNINPSELVMTLHAGGNGGERTRVIHLVDYRTKFKNDNGRRILDVKDITEFDIPMEYTNIRISFTTVNKDQLIDVEVFYILCEPIEMHQHQLKYK